MTRRLGGFGRAEGGAREVKTHETATIGPVWKNVGKIFQFQKIVAHPLALRRPPPPAPFAVRRAGSLVGKRASYATPRRQKNEKEIVQVHPRNHLSTVTGLVCARHRQDSNLRGNFPVDASSYGYLPRFRRAARMQALCTAFLWSVGRTRSSGQIVVGASTRRRRGARSVSRRRPPHRASHAVGNDTGGST